MNPVLILQLIALICLLVAAVWNPNPPVRVSIGWLGLFFWLLSAMMH